MFDSFVAPMTGALTHGFESTHAMEIWAIVFPLFLAISSILHDVRRVSKHTKTMFPCEIILPTFV